MRTSESGLMWYRKTGTRWGKLWQLLADQPRRQVQGVGREPLLTVRKGALEKDRLDPPGAPGGDPEPLGRPGVPGKHGRAAGGRHDVAVGGHDVIDGEGRHRQPSEGPRPTLRERPVSNRGPRDRGKSREVGPGVVVEDVPPDRLEHGLGGQDLERGREASEQVRREKGERGDVVEMGVREQDPTDPALGRQPQRVGQGAGVQSRVAADQERGQAAARCGPAVRAEHADGDRSFARHGATILARLPAPCAQNIQPMYQKNRKLGAETFRFQRRATSKCTGRPSSVTSIPAP